MSSSSQHLKMISRFILNGLGGTPVVGGFFGAVSAAWSEHDQNQVNDTFDQRITALARQVDEQPREAIMEVREKTLVEVSPQQHWVVAYIKLNPNTMEVFDSSNVAGLTDFGTLNCVVNFDEPLRGRFSLQCFGSGPVQLQSVDLHETSAHLRFAEPCPDLVTVMFFNL